MKYTPARVPARKLVRARWLISSQWVFSATYWKNILPRSNQTPLISLFLNGSSPSLCFLLSAKYRAKTKKTIERAAQGRSGQRLLLGYSSFRVHNVKNGRENFSKYAHVEVEDLIARMLLFCPTCSNVLTVEEGTGPSRYRFACQTCPYVYNITKKVSTSLEGILQSL